LRRERCLIVTLLRALGKVEKSTKGSVQSKPERRAVTPHPVTLSPCHLNNRRYLRLWIAAGDMNFAVLVDEYVHFTADAELG
jgi:hypothetical protein